MRAVRDGIHSSGSSKEAVQQIDSLVNIPQELNGTTPALYTVFQAGKLAAQGDLRLAEKFIEMCSSYSVESFTLAGDKTSSRKLIQPIDDGMPSGLKKIHHTQAPSVTWFGTAPVCGDIYSEHQPSRNNKMEYSPTSPASTVGENGCLHSPRGPEMQFLTWLFQARSFCFGY